MAFSATPMLKLVILPVCPYKGQGRAPLAAFLSSMWILTEGGRPERAPLLALISSLGMGVIQETGHLSAMGK